MNGVTLLKVQLSEDDLAFSSLVSFDVNVVDGNVFEPIGRLLGKNNNWPNETSQRQEGFYSGILQ